MTDGVRPVGPVGRDERERDRRRSDRRASTSRELVPVGPVETAPPPASPAASSTASADAAAAFAAQMIGQGGAKRGLKGGPPVMDAARSAYLGAEYSGSNERRPPSGKTKSTDV